ncbi:hypothetical protein DERP_007947 [Dermatophagoides pteronyssinus]|uniref:Uncharacterized protein n=1 Tax=Dermatophagoides pteronyssinus TaxID=6956 RepID=A0ABQ8IT31_DERPT|nr:hypothetical protein DERP_007947 [Dermatophagoides pteronyssinus]
MDTATIGIQISINIDCIDMQSTKDQVVGSDCKLDNYGRKLHFQLAHWGQLIGNTFDNNNHNNHM